MRKYNNDILIAKNAENTDELIKMHNDLLLDLAFFEERLNALRSTLAHMHSEENTEKTADMLTDYQTMHAYVETLQTYIQGIQYTTFSIDKNKMSDRDMAVLKSQHASVKAMRIMAENTNTTADSLRELINDAAKLEYTVSHKRAWLRRGATLLGGLIAAAACVGLICLLMTPGINIVAAATMVPVALSAMLAFFGLHKPVTTMAHMGPFSLPIPVPSSLGAGAAALAGFSLIKKLHITNPVREENARNRQAATINQLTDTLRKKIKESCDGDVKAFLLSVVDKADKMYNSGVDSWFYESQKSKMEKARLILRETAKIIGGDIPIKVNAVLNTRINNSEYTFGELINAQRHSVTFWKSTSKTMSMVRPDELALRSGKTRSVSLSAIAQA